MAIDIKPVADPTAVNVTWPGQNPGIENDAHKNLHVQCQMCGSVVDPVQTGVVKHCPKCGKVLDANRPNDNKTLT
jgi:uncharacterized paraquat-inducible protein A